MKTLNKLLVAIGFSISALCPPASATIVGGAVTGGTARSAGGTFVKLTVPLQNLFGPLDSVGNDNFQSPNLFGFDEVQNVVLAAPLLVDGGAGPIPAGTIVASHYVFFDPGPTQQMIGTVDFDADVLGVMTSSGTLAASDILGNPSVNYLNATGRGLETGDSVTISGARQILFNVSASTPGDYVRVLTAVSPAVPEPSSAALLACGLGAFVLRVGRKRSRSASWHSRRA